MLTQKNKKETGVDDIDYDAFLELIEKREQETAFEDIDNIDYDAFLELVENVSLEIEDDYKSDDNAEAQSISQFPKFVKSIIAIDDLYDYKCQIGHGSSGAVYLAQSVQTYKQYAIKEMPRSDALNRLSFVNEIQVLKSLNHRNIVNFNDAYISNNDYFVATEYCSGGTLHERIIKMKRFSERDCVGFMKIILQTMQYIHSKNIVHRDLKLSNIVFDSPDINHSELKIIDFGESEFIKAPEKRDTFIVGSLSYLPPEINLVRKKKDLYAGDMWSLGVIAYILIEGSFPYIPKHVRKIKKYIDANPLTWDKNIIITDSCKDFIQSLLHKDIHKRLSAQQALQHPWIVNQATDKNLGDVYFSRLQALHFQNKLQKVMVSAVWHEMNEEDKKTVLSHDGYSDDTELINTILCKGSSSNLVIKHTADITNASLDEMALDDILDEIDEETGCDDDIKSSFPMSPPVETIELPMSPPLARSPSMDDTIPTEDFVHILRSSVKQYDIPKIVRQVTDDGITPITFRKIAAYHGPMDTLDFEEEFNNFDLDLN